MLCLLLAVTECSGAIAARDLEIARLQAACEPLINASAARAADLEAQLQVYYMDHIGEIEQSGARSLQLAHGVIGRRMSPPALHLLNKSWNWRTVEVKLRALFGETYFARAKATVDKEKVAKELGPNERTLNECGLKLRQDERFYAEVARS